MTIWLPNPPAAMIPISRIPPLEGWVCAATGESAAKNSTTAANEAALHMPLALHQRCGMSVEDLGMVCVLQLLRTELRRRVLGILRSGERRAASSQRQQPFGVRLGAVTQGPLARSLIAYTALKSRFVNSKSNCSQS